jgi:DNA-binding transcriptional ArsR family regulator
MLNYSKDAFQTFKALGDPTRLAMIDLLSKGRASVSDLAAPFDMSLPAVHQHLGVLEDAGLVNCKKEGRVRWCELNASKMEEAEMWLKDRKTVWNTRMDALDELLQGEKS